MDFVLIPINTKNRENEIFLLSLSLSLSLLPNSHPFLYVSWCQVLVKVNHKLGKLFNMNNVFRMIGISINDLSAPGNLEG